LVEPSSIKNRGAFSRYSFEIFRDIIFIVDRFYGTNRFACAAINALVWMDIKHPVAFVDAIYWALFDARFVFDVYTWFCDYVCHARNST
jgi:hypothetical protein